MSLFIAFDVLRYLEDNDVPYMTAGKNISSGWVGIQCVFCDDHSNHLGINLTSKTFKCWICQTKGNPVKLVKTIKQCSWSKAAEIVEAYSDWTKVQFLEGASERREKTKLRTEFKLLTPDSIPSIVDQYLRNRNFEPESLLRRYPLFYSGPLGDFKFRLIAPIMLNGKMVNYIGRDITGRAHYPYKSCPNEEAEVPLHDLIYGIDEIPSGRTIVLVEGLFDQWRLGFGSGATFGLNLSPNQTALLKKKHPKKISILLDPEAPRHIEDKMASKIWFCPVEIVKLHDTRDPGDLTQKEANELMMELIT